MRRAILLLCVLALVLASCSSDTDEGKDAEPTDATGAAGSVAASPSPTEDVTPGGFAFSDLVGRWIGDVVEPGKTATWATQMSIQDCNVGEPCGGWRITSHDYGPKDMTYECEFSLTYEGYDAYSGAFTFRETDESDCTDETYLLALTPLQDGYTLGVQERWSSDEWFTYGVLRSALVES